MFFSIPD